MHGQLDLFDSPRMNKNTNFRSNFRCRMKHETKANKLGNSNLLSNSLPLTSARSAWNTLIVVHVAICHWTFDFMPQRWTISDIHQLHDSQLKNISEIGEMEMKWIDHDHWIDSELRMVSNDNIFQFFTLTNVLASNSLSSIRNLEKIALI